MGRRYPVIEYMLEVLVNMIDLIIIVMNMFL